MVNEKFNLQDIPTSNPIDNDDCIMSISNQLCDENDNSNRTSNLINLTSSNPLSSKMIQRSSSVASKITSITTKLIQNIGNKSPYVNKK